MSTPDDREMFTYAGLYSDPRLLTLALISFTGTFGANVASPALPSIVDGVGVSEARVGLVMTAYRLPHILLLPVFGVLADMYGRRMILVPSLVLFSTAGVAITVVDSFFAILALRLLQGVGGAAIVPLSITVIGDLWTGPSGSAAQGLRNSANGVGSIILPAIAGFLASVAWNFPFFLYAVGLPTLLLMHVFIPETLDQPKPRSTTGAIREYASAVRVEITEPDMAVLVAGGLFQGVGFLPSSRSSHS